MAKRLHFLPPAAEARPIFGQLEPSARLNAEAAASLWLKSNNKITSLELLGPINAPADSESA